MADEDCRDWRIIDALMTHLKTMKTGYRTVVNDVFIPKKELVLSAAQCPVIMFFYNENYLDEEGFVKEQSSLEAVLAYWDGLDDKDSTESYVCRLKNVGADIRKCIMKNVALGGLCEVVKIESSKPAIIMTKTGPLEVHVTSLRIKRTHNQYDPYK